jgi:hypothetical protein
MGRGCICVFIGVSVCVLRASALYGVIKKDGLLFIGLWCGLSLGPFFGLVGLTFALG